MGIEVTISDGVALVALALSAYAIWTTSRFNRRQISLIDSQERLNKRLLEQGDADALDARKADIGANLVKLGNNRYRVRVFNKGKCAARDVRIEFPEDSGIVPRAEIAGKFPMEILEQHQSVDLIAAPDLGTKRKQIVTLRWTDDHAPDNEKTAYLTL